MKSFLCLFLLALNSFLLQAQEIHLYVAPTGKDSYLGTLQKPFKTIDKAIASASIIQAKKVVIYLRGGTYYLSQTIVVNQQNMLPEALEIDAFGSEKVTISAGRKLSLHWQSYRNGIFKAVVPENIFFERLYVNGQLQAMSQTDKILNHPHDVCVDDDGNIYVAQWASGKVYPYKFSKV
jgi:hypothetical protein